MRAYLSDNLFVYIHGLNPYFFPILRHALSDFTPTVQVGWLRDAAATHDPVVKHRWISTHYATRAIRLRRRRRRLLPFQQYNLSEDLPNPAEILAPLLLVRMRHLEMNHYKFANPV
jgi:hypothetical protein